MRAYTVATAAVTLEVAPKWLDNLLSRIPVRGVIHGRQGVSRRLAPQAIVTLHLATQLARNLGVSLGDAIVLAERAGNSEGVAVIQLFSATTLTIDISATTDEVNARLARAVEITPVPRRGRPPLK